jgi:hypothetical protein
LDLLRSLEDDLTVQLAEVHRTGTVVPLRVAQPTVSPAAVDLA